MKNLHRQTLVLSALCATALMALPTTSAAQVLTRRRDAYERYHVGTRDWVVRPLVDRAERASNSFRAWFEHNYSRRDLGRSEDNRWLKHEIQHMDEAMERLRAKADDHRPGIGREELQDAIDHARKVDHEIDRDRDARFTYREWDDLRRTLNDLADLYHVRGV